MPKKRNAQSEADQACYRPYTAPAVSTSSSTRRPPSPRRGRTTSDPQLTVYVTVGQIFRLRLSPPLKMTSPSPREKEEQSAIQPHCFPILGFAVYPYRPAHPLPLKHPPRSDPRSVILSGACEVERSAPPKRWCKPRVIKRAPHDGTAGVSS